MVTSSFVCCPKCSRHVRPSEPRCPFCGSGRDTGARIGTIVAATLVAASLQACQPSGTASVYGPPPNDPSEGPEVTAPPAASGSATRPTPTNVPAYGPPPPRTTTPVDPGTGEVYGPPPR